MYFVQKSLCLLRGCERTIYQINDFKNYIAKFLFKILIKIFKKNPNFNILIWRKGNQIFLCTSIVLFCSHILCSKLGLEGPCSKCFHFCKIYSLVGKYITTLKSRWCHKKPGG